MRPPTIRVDWAVVPAAISAGSFSTHERDRARRYVHAADRRRYLAGRALLQEVVGEVLGLQAVSLGAHCATCGGDGHGRPVSLDDPTLQLSLSRSEERVVVACGYAGAPIGVDVVSLAGVAFAGFDAVALTPTERDRVAALPEADRPLDRAWLWAGKEAVLKARGVGLTVAPERLELAVEPVVLTTIDVGPPFVCVLATASDVTVRTGRRWVPDGTSSVARQA